MAASAPTMFFLALALKFFIPTLCHGATDQSSSDAIDGFKAFANLPKVVALADTDHDGDLDCMTAVQTAIARDPPSVEYAAFIKGRNGDQNRTITYHIKPGLTIDTTQFTVNDDFDHVLQGKFLYSNYKDCMILEYPVDDKDECVMWATTPLESDVAIDCTEKLQENCKDAVIAYDEETCGPFGL